MGKDTLFYFISINKFGSFKNPLLTNSGNNVEQILVINEVSESKREGL